MYNAVVRRLALLLGTLLGNVARLVPHCRSTSGDHTSADVGELIFHLCFGEIWSFMIK